MSDEPTAPPLVVGDVVWLRSGGPGMTITEIMDTMSKTAWFSGETLRRADLPLAALEPVRGGDAENVSDEELLAIIQSGRKKVQEEAGGCELDRAAGK